MLTVFGSLNCDLTFELQTFPRPGETVLCPGYTARPGGKGANQAVTAARAGVPTAMVGCVGHDPFADVALQGLRAAGVDVAAVQRVDAPTACACIQVDRHGENCIVVASGANATLRAEHVPHALWERSRTWVLQMEVQPQATWQVLAHARAQAARTVLSLAPFQPIPQHVWPHIDWLLLNAGEARALLGADAAHWAQAVHHAFGVNCVVTLGKDGAQACGHAGIWQVPADPVRVVDTTGAGDAFAGGFAAALHQERSVPEALHQAARAAAAACARVGGRKT